MKAPAHAYGGATTGTHTKRRSRANPSEIPNPRVANTLVDGKTATRQPGPQLAMGSAVSDLMVSSAKRDVTFFSGIRSISRL